MPIIRHFRNEKETGAEMLPAIVSGIVPGNGPVSYWPFFFHVSIVTVPEVFVNVNSAQFPSRPYTRRNKKVSAELFQV